MIDGGDSGIVVKELVSGDSLTDTVTVSTRCTFYVFTI